MCEEFQKTGPNTVASTRGFTVEVKFGGGVIYRHGDAEVTIDSEWLAKPPGIILYKRSPANKGLDNMDQGRVDSIFSDVARALMYLGHRVEMWS
jgi:hypothetical protein